MAQAFVREPPMVAMTTMTIKVTKSKTRAYSTRPGDFMEVRVAAEDGRGAGLKGNIGLGLE